MLVGRREEAFRVGGGGGAPTLLSLVGVSVFCIVGSGGGGLVIWVTELLEMEGEGPAERGCLGAACGRLGGGGAGAFEGDFIDSGFVGVGSVEVGFELCFSSPASDDIGSWMLSKVEILVFVSVLPWPRRGGGAGTGFFPVVCIASGVSFDIAFWWWVSDSLLSSSDESVLSVSSFVNSSRFAGSCIWFNCSSAVSFLVSAFSVLPWRELGGGGGGSFRSFEGDAPPV